jgi:hypothetical protein
MNPSFRSAALLGMLAAAAAHGAETRAPSAHERATFEAFYRQENPGAADLRPVFAITRENARSPWTVRASVDSAPRRGLGTLCRMERTGFVYHKGWSAEPARRLVWLQQGGCTPHPQAAELLHRMPDADVLPLLAGQAAALPKARLIMAGNSGCAALRSAPFRFAAIDVGNGGLGNEEVAGLVYRGEGGAQVTVWVRRSATGIDNWHVSCPPRPARTETPAS